LPELPLSYEAREAMKRAARETDDRLNVAIAHFARSWEGTDYSPKHPSFERYMRSMMTDPRICGINGKDAARRFPPKPLPGLDPRSSYRRYP
jgi:hypothetical protein